MLPPQPVFRAFSSEVETGSRKENASNQESRAPFRFHRNGKGSRMLRCPRHPAMTPERAPTVSQLLAFYLEAGVDCALADVPVNRLADPDLVPVPSETAPPRPVTTTAPPPAAPAAPAQAPEAAILSARAAAPTAPTLAALL